MRVLFVAPISVDNATSRYRCGYIAEALTYAGHHADVICADDDSIVINHDIVVLHRLRADSAGWRLFNAAHAIGAAVLYGVDDLIFTPEFAFHAGFLHTDDPVRYRYGRWEMERNRELMRECDGVLASTEFLAEKARYETRQAKPVWVIRNFPGEALRDRLLRSAQDTAALRHLRQDDRITLGYLSGSPTHDGDLADIAAPLANVLAVQPQTRLLIVGRVKLPPLLEGFAAAGRIRRHQPVPWLELPALMSGIDINLAPLEPTRAFSHAKSEVKFLEAAFAGIPTIAGWAAGFAEGVEEGECLLARTAQEWESLLTRLVTDSELRGAIATRARQGVDRRATAAAQAEWVSGVFTEALALRKPVSAKPGVALTVVRRSWREKAERSFRNAEAKAFGAALRYRRHARLLQGELES